MDVWCMCLFCVCTVLCLGRGLATSWSLVQGFLRSVKMIMKPKEEPVKKKIKAKCYWKRKIHSACQIIYIAHLYIQTSSLRIPSAPTPVMKRPERECDHSSACIVTLMIFTDGISVRGTFTVQSL
jgi:hypothetical protein